MSEETQWAWPFEPASEDDRLAHMTHAHHVLSDAADLHRDLHHWTAVVPHSHLTPTEALMLENLPAPHAESCECDECVSDETLRWVEAPADASYEDAYEWKPAEGL